MLKDLKEINKIKKWLDSFHPRRRKNIIECGFAHVPGGYCSECPFGNNKLGLRCGRYAEFLLGAKRDEISGHGCSAIFQKFIEYAYKRRVIKI